MKTKRRFKFDELPKDYLARAHSAGGAVNDATFVLEDKVYQKGELEFAGVTITQDTDSTVEVVCEFRPVPDALPRPYFDFTRLLVTEAANGSAQ